MDSTTLPKQIDLVILDADDRLVANIDGIYKVEVDKLVYCLAAPGDTRPDDFAVSKADGRSLVRLRRVSADAR